jgi:hypothetical protein
MISEITFDEIVGAELPDMSNVWSRIAMIHGFLCRNLGLHR